MASSTPDFSTESEREVLRLVAERQNTCGIPAKLLFSVKLVDDHRLNLTRKPDLHDAGSHTRNAREVGIITPKKTD